MCVCICMYVCVYMYKDECVYVCVCVHVYVCKKRAMGRRAVLYNFFNFFIYIFLYINCVYANE